MKTGRRVFLLSSLCISIYALGSGFAKGEQLITSGPSRPFPFMQEMGESYRELRRQVIGADISENTLQLVRELQRSSLAAKNIMPPTLDGLAAEERKEHFAAYKEQMIQLLHAELDLESQLLRGETSKAAATTKIIDKLMREGHRRFRRRPFRGSP